MSSYLYQRLSSVSSFLIKLSAPVECVSAAGGAQGCKGSIHYTSRASLYGALMMRALLRIKPSDLRQMVFNMLRGKAPFTSNIPTLGSWCGSLTTLSWIINVKGSRFMMWYMTICLHFNSFSDSCLYGMFRRLWKCCWILWGLHEGVFLKLLFCHHLLNLTSVQTYIVFVGHEDCRQRMFMMLCFIQWKWMGIDHYRASNMMYCMSIPKVCISNLYIFLVRTDWNLVCTIALLHQLQDMWQLMVLSVMNLCSTSPFERKQTM